MLKQMLTDLPKSHVDLGTFLLRLGLATTFIFHGYLKLIQSGGTEWSTKLTENAQLAVAWGETICGAALLIGLLSRISAVGLVVIQIGAILIQTGRYGFINVGDYNRQEPDRIAMGAEYNFALIMMSLAVVAMGSGKVSLDHLLYRWYAQRMGITVRTPGGSAVAPV